MLNDLDRFHLVMDVIDRVPALGSSAAVLRQRMADARLAARRYTREHGEDDPAISGWTWELTVRVLVVNAGSSSLKLRLLGGDDAVEQTADVEADRTVGRRRPDGAARRLADARRRRAPGRARRHPVHRPGA